MSMKYSKVQLGAAQSIALQCNLCEVQCGAMVCSTLQYRSVPDAPMR